MGTLPRLVLVLRGEEYGLALVELVGPRCGIMATLARDFQEAFSVFQIRKGILSGQLWLLVAPAMASEDERAFAIRFRDGICVPWPSTARLQAVLCVSKLGLLFAVYCGVHGSTLWAWSAIDGRVRWKRPVGMNLLPQLFFVESLHSVCAGAFEGVFMWGAKDGCMVWAARTQLPADRVWYIAPSRLPLIPATSMSAPSTNRGFLLVRTSEVLGLGSELVVYPVGEPAISSSCLDASDTAVWKKTTLEMIMIVACYNEVVYVRVGQHICAWRLSTGEELWRKYEAGFPPLPTQRTHLLFSQEQNALFVGVGAVILAWNALTSDELFRIDLPGSLMRVTFIPASCTLVGVVGRLHTVISWDAKSGERLQYRIFPKAPSISAGVRSSPEFQVNVVLCHGLDIYLGIVRGDVEENQDSEVLAWCPTSGTIRWCKKVLGPVYCLWCFANVLVVGGWDVVLALSASDGQLLWRTKLHGMAKSLVPVGKDV